MHEVTAKELYDRIEQQALLMKYKDITELCKVSGTSRGALSDLKYGRSGSLSMKTMTKLANALQVSIDFFTAPEPDEAESSPAGKGAYDRDMRRIERARGQMSAADREKMMRLLELSFSDFFSDDYEDTDTDE